MALDNFVEAVFEKALNDWVVASAMGEKICPIGIFRQKVWERKT